MRSNEITFAEIGLGEMQGLAEWLSGDTWDNFTNPFIPYDSAMKMNRRLCLLTKDTALLQVNQDSPTGYFQSNFIEEDCFLNILKVFDYELTDDIRADLRKLLGECFADLDYPSDREYFKQIPHFRLIAMDEMRLIAQVGLDYRVMNLDGVPIKVLGIIDLCVAEAYRSQGIASLMLLEIEKFSENKDVDFLLLVADNSSLYLKNGFRSHNNNCKWMKIDEKQSISFGMGHEMISEIMVKQLGNKEWHDGELDLLGYLY